MIDTTSQGLGPEEKKDKTMYPNSLIACVALRCSVILVCVDSLKRKLIMNISKLSVFFFPPTSVTGAFRPFCGSLCSILFAAIGGPSTRHPISPSVQTLLAQCLLYLNYFVMCTAALLVHQCREDSFVGGWRGSGGGVEFR